MHSLLPPHRALQMLARRLPSLPPARSTLSQDVWRWRTAHGSREAQREASSAPQGARERLMFRAC